MSDTYVIPTISFINDLSYDINVFDSYRTNDLTPDEENYMAHLTLLGMAKAKSTTVIQPIHNSTTFILENASGTKPVKRCFKKSSDLTTTSFSIEQSDEDIMTTTFKFIDVIVKTPSDPMSVAFLKIINDPNVNLPDDIDNFFKNYPDYVTCSYPSYMMGAVYNSKNPPPPPAPGEPPVTISDKTYYSLSKLVYYMGGSWPSGMPDITVSDFSCKNENSKFNFTVDIDISNLPFETPEIQANIKSLFKDTTITFKLLFNYALSAAIFATRLELDFDNFSLPVGQSKTINVEKPTITLDINPIFKFVVFTMKGTIPFNIHSKPFDANISMTIDNVEAAIGVTISGDNVSFPAPPGLKGLFFDEFGVSMGIMFEPPAFALGLETKFHIGTPKSGNVISLNDDTFALICTTEGDIPVPVFASFYVPQLDINTVIELFTNVTTDFDLPVNFSDLSFRWSANPMDAYALPDGTLSQGGYGFSANIDIFAFQFHGIVNLDLNSGLTADVEMSPINWSNVFQLSGDGKGVTIKVDENGNPIPNNIVANTQALQDAVAKATPKQIIAPGGPVLIINTLSAPIVHVNAKASLFELIDFEITADVNKDGISFLLDYGAVLKKQVNVTLADFHNLSALFGYYIDQTITVPAINGVHLGSFRLNADVDVHFAIKTSLSDIVLSVGGDFDFESIHRSFGDFTTDIHIQKITDFLEKIGDYIASEAKQIFSEFLGDAQQWANKVKNGFITGADAVGSVLKNMWNADSVAVTSIMKAAGYAGQEIASEIKNTWNCGLNDVTWAMKQVGYSAEEIASSVKNGLNAAAQDVTNSFKWLGYAANDVGAMIKDVFGGDSIAVASIMKAAGYTADEVGGAIKNAWNCTETDVAYAMKAVGYTADEVADTLKDTFNAGINDVASAMKAVGYGADVVASTLKDAFNTSVDAVATAMNAVGYAADTVADAFKSLGGDFESLGKKIGDKLNPSNW